VTALLKALYLLANYFIYQTFTATVDLLLRRISFIVQNYYHQNSKSHYLIETLPMLKKLNRCGRCDRRG
jgi:hypothetical protein